jgi:hypothetical protein
MTQRHPYYKYDKLFSYNATYNFVVGARGLGKTFGACVKAVKDGVTKGDQFIYMRRFKEELSTARNTFFAAIEYKFPQWDFRSNGMLAQAAHADTREDKKRQWITIGYFVSLSTAQQMKSVAFPKVKTIIFDEFIIEKGAVHYLPNEAEAFNNFYATVDRWTDKTKVLFLANSVSIMNPYFIKYEIRPDQGDEFIVKGDGFILCHFPEAAAFASSVFETKFGKFIKNTDYADYAVGNVFSDNHEKMLAEKHSKARYLFTLECKTGTFSVWHANENDEYFVQSKLPKQEVKFTLDATRMDNDKTLMTFTDRPLQYLRTAFRNGRMNFDKPATRNSFTEIFKR